MPQRIEGKDVPKADMPPSVFFAVYTPRHAVG